MTVSTPTPAARARGALFGLAAAGPGVVGLAEALGEELLAPEFDLGRTVERWLATAADGAGLPGDLAAALLHLRQVGAPPRAGEPGATGLALHLAPVALLTYENPANLLSGSFHLAAITHPGAEAAWAAVAFNVALARLLQGFRDFVPDVTEALRANEAPAALLDAVRRLPLVKQAALEPARGDAVAQLVTALWLAHHEPKVERGFAWLDATGATPVARAASAVLLGARGGDAAVLPHLALAPERRAELDLLALRLARVGTQ